MELLGEFWEFMKVREKFWLFPIALMLLLLGALIIFTEGSAAALIHDGVIIAATQEKRFTRKKHDHKFPLKASEYCLKTAGIGIQQIDHVVFYDKADCQV